MSALLGSRRRSAGSVTRKYLVSLLLWMAFCFSAGRVALYFGHAAHVITAGLLAVMAVSLRFVGYFDP